MTLGCTSAQLEVLIKIKQSVPDVCCSSHFPALNPQVANVQAQSKQKQQAKSKKDEVSG